MTTVPPPLRRAPVAVPAQDHHARERAAGTTSAPAPAGEPEDKRRHQAEARATRAAARAAARLVVPARSPDLAHLTLPALRTYRKSLLEEEDKVSYWRRILQARLDTLRDDVRASRGDMSHLAPVLSAPRVQGGRTALVTVVPTDDVPPLPDLARLWELTPDPHDPHDAQAVAELEQSLASAEVELSSYRSALHRRLATATNELIARYREDPSVCLAALPLRPAASRA